MAWSIEEAGVRHWTSIMSRIDQASFNIIEHIGWINQALTRVHQKILGNESKEYRGATYDAVIQIWDVRLNMLRVNWVGIVQ